MRFPETRKYHVEALGQKELVVHAFDVTEAADDYIKELVEIGSIDPTRDDRLYIVVWRDDPNDPEMVRLWNMEARVEMKPESHFSNCSRMNLVPKKDLR